MAIRDLKAALATHLRSTENMKIQLITILALLTLLFGCSTTNQTQSVSASSAQPEMPKEGRAKERDVREWAQYYLDTGSASDMAEALKMAREMFWPEIDDPNSALAKIEERNEALMKQLEKNEK